LKPTIKDIARKVGKSTTTVSRALNDYNDISAETKDLVRQAAQTMGYIPNATAQRLQKRTTDTIGLILPTFGPRFSDPFFSEFLTGVGNQASEMGYDMLVATRAPGIQEMQSYQSDVATHRVDGFILVRTRSDDPRIAFLKHADFPFAAFGRVSGDSDFLFVDEDGGYGLELIVDHLAQLGHRRIAFITAPENLTFTHHRLAGAQAAMGKYGLEMDPELIKAGDLTQRGGYECAKLLLDLPQPPTAIAAFNDLMAIGAMSAAQERELVVGKQISISGFDNIPMAEHAHPTLTTVHQPIYQIGRRVCELLIRKIRNEPLETTQVILKPSLIIRLSTGPVL
jgi:LacI family transcriptional regulator